MDTGDTNMDEQTRAAHRMAYHLRKVAECLPALSPHSRTQVLSDWNDSAKAARQVAASQVRIAELLELSAPLPPLGDGEKLDIQLAYADRMGWIPHAELVNKVCESWTEADWHAHKENPDAG